MKKLKFTVTVILVKGIMMAMLGIVHLLAVFILNFEKEKSQMTALMFQQFMLWFALGGLFFIFIGIIDLISYYGIKNKIQLAWKTAVLSALICCIAAPAVIAIYLEGPPFLILALGLLEIIPLVIFKSEFN